jgi:hypothetical protein
MKTTGRATSRLATALSLGLAVLLLASCGGGSGVQRERDSDGKIIPNARDLDPAGTLYSDTVQKADDGVCDADAIEVLTCFSYRGHGYEGAQASLGQCLIRTGKVADGTVWLKRAANAGWPDAQKRLAQLYASGKGAPQDLVEAATWNNLYLKNPSLLSLGVTPDRSLSQQLHGKLTAEQGAEARRRADAWSPSYWEPDTALNTQTAAVCSVRAKRRMKVSPDEALEQASKTNRGY